MYIVIVPLVGGCLNPRILNEASQLLLRNYFRRYKTCYKPNTIKSGKKNVTTTDFTHIISRIKTVTLNGEVCLRSFRMLYRN